MPAIPQKPADAPADISVSPAIGIPDMPDTETGTFNVQYHKKRCQVSFAADNTVMVITVPMTHTNRTFIRGFLLDMYEVACQWFAQKEQLRQKLSISGQKFNFKQGIQRIMGRK